MIKYSRKGSGFMVVVFGGAFNPPTIAHKDMYYLVEAKFGFDYFIYLPVSNKYRKSNLIADSFRVDMLKLLIKDLPKARISLLEVNDHHYLGTYESLIRIKADYQQKIAFVIGSDNLLLMKNWIKAESLIKDFQFIVVNRNNQDALEIIANNPLLKEHQSNFKILPGFNQYISSTAFRETLDDSLVTKEVFQYIMKKDLYRGN